MSNSSKIIAKIGAGVLAFIFIISAAGPAWAQEGDVDPNFNPNFITSDGEILDYNSMTLSEIQKFLEQKGSFLATYSTTNPDGTAMTAAEIIYDRAQANKISPKFILVLLQKEQGLVEDADPEQGSLDWATGYGCPDSGGCNARWKGLWKQINSATLQFFDYIENPQDYNYKKGQTYTFLNKYSSIIDGPVVVTPANNATAALYNYTPHVYNGNYNFYKLWKRYFNKLYPSGTLLQAKGDKVVYLLQGSRKRPFASKSALTSRFDEKKIVTVDQSVLNNYADGAPIKFPNYSLIRSPRGTIFLLVDDKRRGFSSKAVFNKFGYNSTEVVNASWDDINAYQEAAPLTATSTYPTGALLQDTKTGGVYWVEEGKKAPLLDKNLLTYGKLKKKKIIKATAKELDKYPTTDPLLFPDGELLTSENSAAIYLISGGKKRPFMSSELFTKMGYKKENVMTVSPQLLAKYENGEAIKEGSN